MTMPLGLAEYHLKTRLGKSNKNVKLSECKDSLVYVKTYRCYELYTRINDRFVYTRNLSNEEIQDWYFHNGQSLGSVSIIERIK